jgi:hypothetical protein
MIAIFLHLPMDDHHLGYVQLKTPILRNISAHTSAVYFGAKFCQMSNFFSNWQKKEVLF